MPGNKGYRMGVGWRVGKEERKRREGRKGNRMVGSLGSWLQDTALRDLRLVL